MGFYLNWGGSVSNAWEDIFINFLKELVAVILPLLNNIADYEFDYEYF